MSGCVCDHEAIPCRCGHLVRNHVIVSSSADEFVGLKGSLACPVHGWMSRCQFCGCQRFKRAEAEDPRDHGLTAEGLHAVADRLYDPDDSRLEPMTQVSVKFNTIRTRLRALADAIEETSKR